MSDFVHLHNHTHYSILDAAATPAELVSAAVADGQSAVALTDHGVMYGVVDFYKAAKTRILSQLLVWKHIWLMVQDWINPQEKPKQKRKIIFIQYC